jgi:NADH:ubiquinone oxidoreductase subunit F (NADH-binding)
VTHTEHTYVVCRALDTDPGARARGVLLSRDLQAVLDGLRMAGLTAGATKGYLCVDAGDAAGAAAAEAALGRPDAAGRGFDVSVVALLPSLVLADDSALLRVLEGRQAVPHVSLPPSATPSLWGRPARVYNAEELVRMAAGAPAARTVTVRWGEEARVADVSEDATVREVLRDVAGVDPVADSVRAVRVGGATGRFLAGAGLDTPVGAEETWLPGVIEIVPEGVCGVVAVRDAMRELGSGSCGACVVCREGIRQLADTLADIADVRAAAESPELMRELGAALEAGSLCGLGCAAADVLRTGLEVFAVDFRAHLDGAPCPGAQTDA